MKRAPIVLMTLFVVLMPLGLSILPWNMQLGDLLFPFLVVAMIVAGWRTRLHRLDLFVAAYLLGSLASVPGSLSPSMSLLAGVKEVYLVGIYLVTAAAVSRMGAERLCRWLTRSAIALSAVSLGAAAVFYATGFTWRLFGDPGLLPYVGTVFRIWGAATGPELFGNLLTFVVPLLLLDDGMRARSASWIAAVGLVIAAEVMTFSLTLGGFAAAAAMALWPAWKSRPLSRAALAAIAAGLVVVFNVAAIATFRQVDVTFGKNPAVDAPRSYVRLNDPSGADTVDLRVSYYPMSYYVIKKVAWSAFLARPVTGIGLGAFPLEAQRAYDDGRLFSPYQRVNAHSTPFGRLAETGLVGTVPLLAFLVALVVYATKAARSNASERAVAWALVAGLAGLLVNGVNVDLMNFRFFWFGAGIVRALAARQSSG